MEVYQNNWIAENAKHVKTDIYFIYIMLITNQIKIRPKVVYSFN